MNAEKDLISQIGGMCVCVPMNLHYCLCGCVMGGFQCLMVLLGVQMIYEANNRLKLKVGVRCQELVLLTLC